MYIKLASVRSLSFIRCMLLTPDCTNGGSGTEGTELQPVGPHHTHLPAALPPSIRGGAESGRSSQTGQSDNEQCQECQQTVLSSGHGRLAKYY